MEMHLVYMSLAWFISPFEYGSVGQVESAPESAGFPRFACYPLIVRHLRSFLCHFHTSARGRLEL